VFVNKESVYINGNKKKVKSTLVQDVAWWNWVRICMHNIENDTNQHRQWRWVEEGRAWPSLLVDNAYKKRL